MTGILCILSPALNSLWRKRGEREDKRIPPEGTLVTRAARLKGARICLLENAAEE